MSSHKWTKITIGGQPVLDSRSILKQLAFRPDWAADLDRIYCPAGAEPGGGKFLVAKKHFDLITSTGAVDIVWTSGTGAESTAVTFKKYVITRAFAALPIPDSPLVVTVADARHVLRDSATAKRYNVAEGSGYETATTNGGTAYTWAQLLADLWTEVPTGFVGSLTTTGMPATTPRNILVLGESAWLAIARITRQQGREVYFDPFEATISIADPAGTAAAPPDAKKFTEAAAPRLAYANVPHTVRVFFAKADCEEPPHYIDVATGDADAAAGSKATAWGATLAVMDGATATNATVLQAEADEVAAGIVASRSAAAEPARDRYTGIHDSVPVAGVHSVEWMLHPTESTELVYREWSVGGMPTLAECGGGSFTGYKCVLTSGMSTGTGTADIFDLDTGATIESGAAIKTSMRAFLVSITSDEGWCWKQGDYYRIGNIECPGSGGV